MQNRVTNLITAVQNGNVDAITSALGEVTKIATTLNELLSGIQTDQIQNEVTKALNTVISTLQNAKTAINKAQQIDLESLLNKTSQTVSNAITILEKYQKELPAIKEEIHTANR